MKCLKFGAHFYTNCLNLWIWSVKRTFRWMLIFFWSVMRAFDRVCYQCWWLWSELAVEVFEDAWRVDLVSNCSMISCNRFFDFNPTFGPHPNMAEYGEHLILFFWFCTKRSPIDQSWVLLYDNKVATISLMSALALSMDLWRWRWWGLPWTMCRRGHMFLSSRITSAIHSEPLSDCKI